MDLPDSVTEFLDDRRKVAILLVILLVVLGAGIGTLSNGGDSDEPPVITATPVPATPTPTPTSSPSTPTDTAEPTTPTATPTVTSTPPTTRTPGPTTTATARSGVGGDPVTLETVGSSAILDYDNLSPGESGSGSVVFRNAGDQSGRLSIANVTAQDHENGIVGPEAGVDSTPNDGELSEHVMVVVRVEYDNGTVQHLYDTDQGARSLASLANESAPAEAGILDAGEEATVVFEWSVPSSTGNVIQSDGVTFGVDFRLTQTS